MNNIIHLLAVFRGKQKRGRNEPAKEAFKSNSMPEVIENKIVMLRKFKSDIMVNVLADEGLPAPLIFVLDKYTSSSISYIEQDFDYLKSSQDACLIPENYEDYDDSLDLIMSVRSDFPPLVKVKISKYLKDYESIVNSMTIFDKQRSGFLAKEMSVS